MLKASAIIAALFVSHCYGSTETCEEKSGRACPLPDGIDDMFEKAVPDVSFLHEKCGPVLSFVKCIVDFNETCRFENMQIGVTLQEVHDAVSEICDHKSEVGQAYRENVDCVNDKTSEFRHTVRAYEVETSWFAFYISDHIEDFQYRRYEAALRCINVQIADRHMRNFLESICGEGAVKVLERIESLFLNHCPSPQSMLRFRALYDQFLEERENIIQE